MKKIKSHDWQDGDKILEGVATDEFYYDVSGSGLRNTLFLGKHAIELEPAVSLELAKWLFINSIRGQLSGAMAIKNSELLDGITQYCSDFIEEIQQANLDFNAESVLTKHFQSETHKATQAENIRKLALAACSFEEATRETILSDPSLMKWLKNVIEN